MTRGDNVLLILVVAVGHRREIYGAGNPHARTPSGHLRRGYVDGTAGSGISKQGLRAAEIMHV
jgi:hypothetical protein